MALATLDAVRKVFNRVRDADRGDGELLSRYRAHRDQDAFGSLVRRHGPMVFGVCNRVLRDPHAADDAFQATFLVLAKKADRIRPPDRLSPWLYGVAYRTAMKARGRAFRRQQVEQQYAAEMTNRTQAQAAEDVTDLLPIIDEHLNALPEKYRTPLVLCGVQGLNKAQAAERLGLPEGTVSSRLARGREMLRDRLARRGVAVPLAALGALLTADSLHAAVTPELADATAELAMGSVAVSPAVLSLSHEVLSSMTFFKLKMVLSAVTAVALTTGGFGLYAVHADEKKPAPPGEKPGAKPAEKPGAKPDGEKPKPANPDGEKPKPGEKPGEKPGVKVAKAGGLVASVDAKESTIMVATKGDNGVVEKLFKVAPDAKVFIDGADGKLADIPKNSTAALLIAGGKEGALQTATEVRISGPTFVGVVAKVDATTVLFEGEKTQRIVKLAPTGKVVINGKDAKLADIKAGDKLTVTMSADQNTAILLVGGTKPGGEGDKPGGEKPIKNPKFGGKVASVDASARAVTLVSKGEGGKEMVVKLTADAKITIDGKDAKIGDIQKNVFATFTLVSAKDGQPREANEVIIAGVTFGGSVKQVDTATITVGSEKSDRVFKLLPTTKIVINGKDAKAADLKAGDRVMVTLSADESGATLIVSGKKTEGEK